MPTVSTEPTPVERWRRAVEERAVPEAIQQQAAEPFVLEPERFRWRPEEDATQPVRPSRRKALEALPDQGCVLDVGVGGGASSLGLVPRAARITGVDKSEGMLAAFLDSARAAGIEARAVHGAWPDVAGEVEPADVAVCHHAIYGTVDIEPFVAALTAAARHRVVVEVSSVPPTAGLGPLWKTFHGIDRPEHPVAEDLQAVLAWMGLAADREDIVLPPRHREVTPELVAFARRRLHVGPERDAEIEAYLRARPPQKQCVVAFWWPGSG
jgi:SAM-dependent methyltransferase